MSRISDLLNKDTTDKTLTINTSSLFDALTNIVDNFEKVYNKAPINKNTESKKCCCSSSTNKQENLNPTLEDKEYKKEAVNHPSHYQGNKFEVIDIIEDYKLGFNLGNAIKYILRAGKKNDYKEDLQKAIWYLQREISHC